MPHIRIFSFTIMLCTEQECNFKINKFVLVYTSSTHIEKNIFDGKNISCFIDFRICNKLTLIHITAPKKNSVVNSM